MSVLVIAEIKDGNLKNVSLELATAGKSLGGSVTAWLPNGNEEQARQLCKAGADTVLISSHEAFNPQSHANYASALASEKGVRVVLLPHSMNARDLAGRIAIKLNAALVADVVSIKGNLDEIEVQKPVYAGKAYANIKLPAPAVLTIRPNSIQVKADHSGPEAIESVSVETKAEDIAYQDIEMGSGKTVELQDAAIIVSGGRGIKGPENWPILEELCEALGGAALGASRAAVDAGWISHSKQVGQTGKTVSPNCYIACGISGAIQHLAGMNSSRFIVAINKAEDAPIFKVATYGIVGDLFEVVPALTAELKKTLK